MLKQDTNLKSDNYKINSKICLEEANYQMLNGFKSLKENKNNINPYFKKQIVNTMKL